MTLRSSRTLPGQPWPAVRVAAGVAPRTRFLNSVLKESMKYSTSSGMSSACAAAAALDMGRTLRRRTDPTRNRCVVTSSSRLRLVAAMTRTSTRMSADPPTRLKLFSSRNRSSLACSAGGHLADLVEEHGSAVGHFEQTLLLHSRVREGTSLVAEQLAFQELLGERGAGDRHEGPRRRGCSRSE